MVFILVVLIIINSLIISVAEALQLPSVKPKDAALASFDYSGENCGIRSVLDKPSTARDQILPQHPLENVLKQVHNNEEAFHKAALLHAQGPAGPMIRAMELRAANSIGRLPFLQSSNFQRDVLTGKDEEIDFDDVFGLMPRYNERSVHPHAVMDAMEHKFNL